MYAITIPAGRLTIRPSDRDANSCEVWFNEQWVGNYNSAAAAARAISERRSGYLPIDSTDVALPSDIEGWAWVSVSSENPERPSILTASLSVATCGRT